MLTVDQIRERLKPMKLSRVAAAAKIHPATLYRFMRGTPPMHTTVLALCAYLESLSNV